AAPPLLVGGGVGIAPLAILQDRLADPGQPLLGFRDAAHAAGGALLQGARIATDDGSVGHRGLVTELLRDELARDSAVTVHACGPFDAIAARRVFGEALLARFPFSAFVSKTITLAPRQGNPPPRLWELPAGLLNSIGLPNQGLAGYLRHDLPELAALPVPLI